MTLKKVAIIQARMGSTRLPGKVLMKIQGKTILEHIVERLKKSKLIDQIVIATSDKKDDIKIVDLARKIGTDYFQGSEQDVLDRYLQAAKLFEADIIIRVTADNPLTDPHIIDTMLEEHIKKCSDYTFIRGLPVGICAEVFSIDSLKKSNLLGKESHHREHANEFILENQGLFEINLLKASPDIFRPNIRLTVDTWDDFKAIEKIFKKFYRDNCIISTIDVIELFDKNPRFLDESN